MKIEAYKTISDRIKACRKQKLLVRTDIYMSIFHDIRTAWYAKEITWAQYMQLMDDLNEE